MSSKKSSAIRNSRSDSEKTADKLKHQKLFLENQQIIFTLGIDSNKSGVEETKINSDNCIEALQEIAEVRLGGSEETKELLEEIISALSELNVTDLSLVNRMIAFKNIEAQAITPLSELPTVLKSIKKYLLNNPNPITTCCLKVFYSYVSFMCNKHQQLDMKKVLKITIKNFITFISETLYHIFRPMFVLFEKKKVNVYLALLERFAPTFVTEPAEWKQLYPKVIKIFGKKPLKVLRDQQPSYFQMGDSFNCQSCPNPFIRTIVNLQQLDSAASIKHKLKILKQLKSSMTLDIKDHQQSTMIQIIQPQQQDLLPCLQYCIMKSDRAGLVEAMEYIELFYEKENKKDFSQEYLDAKGVNHIIKSLKIAGMALRSRDIELSMMNTGIENPE